RRVLFRSVLAAVAGPITLDIPPGDFNLLDPNGQLPPTPGLLEIEGLALARSQEIEELVLRFEAAEDRLANVRYDFHKLDDPTEQQELDFVNAENNALLALMALENQITEAQQEISKESSFVQTALTNASIQYQIAAQSQQAAV